MKIGVNLRKFMPVRVYRPHDLNFENALFASHVKMVNFQFNTLFQSSAKLKFLFYLIISKFNRYTHTETHTHIVHKLSSLQNSSSLQKIH